MRSGPEGNSTPITDGGELNAQIPQYWGYRELTPKLFTDPHLPQHLWARPQCICPTDGQGESQQENSPLTTWTSEPW